MIRSFSFLFLVLVFSSLTFAQTCQSGETQPCGSSDVGNCVMGTQSCSNGVWGQCFGAVYPEDEVCGNGEDDDCDGVIDDQCVCWDGETRSCGPQREVGICIYGIETCANNTFGSCVGAVYSLVSDFCGSGGKGNGLDDDCDGGVDEGCTPVVATPPPAITCFDGVSNYGELGVDCGGSCVACVGEGNCFDGVMNQDEEDIDCGGRCGSCPTCDDGLKNRDETSPDCGGICGKCGGDVDNDGDGLLAREELLAGTSDNHFDTDGDGYGDAEDKMPLCPNTFCDTSFGETALLCPQDCEEEQRTPLSLVLGLLFFFFAVTGWILWKMKHTGKTSRFSSENKQSAALDLSFDARRFAELQKRTKKTHEDDEVENSFKKVENILKK